MAAENDFPLETIIIIVVVIVVLFIAIFFGARFFNTRIKTKRVLKPVNLTSGRGERSGGVKYKYNGGDETADRTAVCEFIKDSISLLDDDTDSNKYLAGVDTIHNMFRSCDIEVPDGSMKKFYYPDGKGKTPGQTEDLDGFKQIINNSSKISAEKIGKIAKSIDSVKLVLNTIKACTPNVETRLEYLKTEIDDTVLKNLLTYLLKTEYTKWKQGSQEYTQFNTNLLSFITMPTDDSDLNAYIDNIVKQLIADRSKIDAFIQNCGLTSDDLYPNKRAYDKTTKFNADTDFYQAIGHVLEDDNELAAILNDVNKDLKSNADSLIGRYMMMWKFGDINNFIKFNIKNNPKIKLNAKHTNKDAYIYTRTQIYAYPHLYGVLSEFENIKNDAENELNGGGGGAKAVTVDPNIKLIVDLLDDVKNTYDTILDLNNIKIPYADRFNSLNDGLIEYGKQLLKSIDITSTVHEIIENQKKINEYINKYYDKFKQFVDTTIVVYSKSYGTARNLTTRNAKNIFNTRMYILALSRTFIPNAERMLSDNQYFNIFIKSKHSDILDEIDRIKNICIADVNNAVAEYDSFLASLQTDIISFEQKVDTISTDLNTKYTHKNTLFIAHILQDGKNIADIKPLTKQYIATIKQISGETNKNVTDLNLDKILDDIKTTIKDFKQNSLAVSLMNATAKYDDLKTNINQQSAYKTFQDAVILRLNTSVKNAKDELEKDTDAIDKPNIVDKINQAITVSNYIFESNNCVEIINTLKKVIAKPTNFDGEFTRVSTESETLNKSIVKFLEDNQAKIIANFRSSKKLIDEAEQEKNAGKDINKIKGMQDGIKDILNINADSAFNIYTIFANIFKTIQFVKNIVPTFEDLYNEVSDNYTIIEQHYLRIQEILVDLAAVTTIKEKLEKITLIIQFKNDDISSLNIKYEKIKDNVNKLLANINRLFDHINNSNTNATNIKNNAEIIVANISDQTINKTEYDKAIASKLVIDTSKDEVEKQYKIADKIKIAINSSVPTLLQSINDGINQLYDGFKTLVSNGFDNSDKDEVDKFINDATSELDVIKKGKDKFNLEIGNDVSQLELQIKDIENAETAADPEFKKLIGTNNQFINDVMDATLILVENTKKTLRPTIDAKNQEIIQKLDDIKTKNDNIAEPDYKAVISHNVYNEIKAVTKQIVDNITSKSNTTTINTKFEKDLEKIHTSFENADAEFKTARPDIQKIADSLKLLNDSHKEIIDNDIITKFDALLANIDTESVKLDPYIDIANLMKDIGDKHSATIVARDVAKTASDAATAENNKVIAFAKDAQTKADDANMSEQTAIALIGSISDSKVSSELAILKKHNTKLQKLNNKIRTNAGDPVKKAAAAAADAAAALADANTQLDTFNTVSTNVLYTQNLAYWIDGTNYNAEHSNAENNSKTAKDAAEIAQNTAEKQPAIAKTALTDAKTKLDSINLKLALINSILETIKHLVNEINNEDDDEPSIVPQQLEDDKVKPFSQNSYDILPLDYKIATLSSNIEFSESVDYKPVNSFMYVVTPYDKKEQSPDDKVLEMVSFARTLRMPIKDKSVITKASELFKKYHGTKKIIPGMWVSRGGKLVTAVKPTNIDELERYIELMNRSNQFEIPRATGGGLRI
jgi:hypothetical protein